MLNLSALYLSQKRLNEVLTPELIPVSIRSFQISERENYGLSRTAVISQYETAALRWMNAANLPTLGELIAKDRIAEDAFFTHLGPFYGNGIEKAAMQFQLNKPITAKPLLWTKLDSFREGLRLEIQAHPENYTSQSAPGEMAGRRRLFLVGRLTDADETTLRAQAYIIGYLHDESRGGIPNIDRFGRLDWQMEVYPVLIDNFAQLENEKPKMAELKKLLTIPESEVKAAFASILDEPFVPKDWGGEKSDLVSTQVRIDGMQASTAFAFKGPAVSKKLTVAAMGKNGDQISRLFSEPVDLVVVQHCEAVTSAVRDHMRAFATRINNLRPFCIIDGADTVRIFKAYEKLGFVSDRAK